MPVGGARAGIFGGGAIPDSGVFRYNFEEGSGNTVYDSWNNNDGSISGATFSTDSKVDSYSLSFDGSDDYVDVPDMSGRSYSSFSVGAWVKPISIANNDNIFSWDSDVEAFISSTWGILMNGTYHQVGSPSTDEWTHVFYTYDGSTVTTYENGSDVGSTSISGDVTGTTFYVGRKYSEAKTLDGYLDDFRFYDKALTSTEVSNLYNTGSISG